jgi:hypothetical protein
MQSEDLTIRGSLAESSLAELLSSISRSRETGIFNFHDSGRWKSVYFRDGQIVYATSNVHDDRLGEFLIKRGRVTVRQFLEASRSVSPGKRLGGILVEQGALAPDELIGAIQEHVLEIVYSLFEWTRGEYEFVMKELSAEGPVQLDLSTEKVILEGIRRLADFTRVFASFGSLDVVLRRSEQADAITYKLDLDSDEAHVLSLINGRLTLEQVLALSYLSNFETLRILFALLSVGVLDRGVGAAERQPAARVNLEQVYELEEIVDHYNRNFGAVFAYLEEKLGEEAEAFADRTVAEVSQQFPVLFDGIDLSSGGRVDFEQLLANLGEQAQEARKAALVNGLNELTYALLLGIGQRFGREEQEQIAAKILSQARPAGGKR